MSGFGWLVGDSRRGRQRAFGATAPVAVIAGLLLAPAVMARQAGGGTELERGMVLYAKLCAQCHGDQGDGLGTAAPRVLPKPRDFTAGKYKIRQTPSGQLPTDADLTRVIRQGMPYTSMPAWPQLSDAEVSALVTAIKSFSPEFANPERKPVPIAVPKAPPSTAESVEKGKVVYEQLGCAGCHGQLGRGDGNSAPTLKDDWGHFIRAADLSQRWTYRGGATREDIYRTFTTGLNGTPMPSFAEALSDEERWQLVDYIEALGDGEGPGYANLLLVKRTADDLDLARGAELFADAPSARFPIVGQITEPGREFHPSANAISVRAVYNAREIAFELSWHDMRAETRGRNAPDLAVSEEVAAQPAAATEEGGDFWGDEAVAEPAAGGDDFWGEEAAAEPTGGDDFWGEETGDANVAATTPDTEFSDAVAIQLPSQLPTGIRKPYFIFGDAQNPVDLWFVDLATQAAQRYTGAGSSSLTMVAGEDVSTVTSYDRGRWTVLLKRSLRGTGSVTFAEDQFVPIAFSVWDGFNRERGNKRGLTQWVYLYTMPAVTPSPFAPMAKSFAGVLLAELLLVAWVRRRQRAVAT